MFSFIKWLNECICYYFSGKVKEQLIAEINNEKNNIQPIVRQDLIASILQNKAQTVVGQIEQLPEQVRNDLMDIITQINDVCINQSENTANGDKKRHKRRRKHH